MRPARIAVAAMTAAVLLWPASRALASLQDPAAPTAEPSAAVLAEMDGTVALSDSASGAPATPATDQPAASGMLAGLGTPVDAGKLEAIRGGTELVVNDMRLAGVVADNVANRVITGSNAISDGAFSNASGLPTVIQNTGANTLIQNATILNVQFRP